MTAPRRAVRGKYRCRSARRRAKTTSWNMGDPGDIQMGTGGWPILHAATTQRMDAPGGRGPAVHRGGANLSDQRASRLAKRNRNRQGPINNVPFPRARTLGDRIGEMRRLYLGRLRDLEFGVPAGLPTMRTQAQTRLRMGAPLRTTPRQWAAPPQGSRPSPPAEQEQTHVEPRAD